MITRKDLRRDGADLRKRLFGSEAGTHFVPNYADLRAELAFGVVWNRPGLALPDRMIAALAALCSVQRLNHLRRHIVAALDLGLMPRFDRRGVHPMRDLCRFAGKRGRDGGGRSGLRRARD
jgi:alkylhydroperoxidase/carboxymuconolactone decarboxylase family protein YurZ